MLRGGVFYVFINRTQSGPFAAAAVVVVVADVVGRACSVAAAVGCAIDVVACAFAVYVVLGVAVIAAAVVLLLPLLLRAEHQHIVSAVQ